MEEIQLLVEERESKITTLSQEVPIIGVKVWKTDVRLLIFCKSGGKNASTTTSIDNFKC